MNIDEKDIKWQFIRAAGPGGQKVNKVATAAELRFNIKKSGLAADVKERLIQIAGNRINAEGELVITGRRFRTQNRNREDALARLQHFIQLASYKPKKRKKTKIPKAAKEKRLADKRKRGDTKRQRQKSIDNH
ncbi:alternative ribosome rescue aminoacyl-tRNA hydrolase ArfB [Candidiatus Paracoxiella cheracis]|uniref:alternative ribosome rescue aminoacyl-tRNA hydrolase ArfB n=1 Tax=Candidiatus Paracoxiella cheracis TaxID=3405120 RepID=UPI003BF56581